MHLAQLGTPEIKPLGMQKSPSGHGLVVVGAGVVAAAVVVIGEQITSVGKRPGNCSVQAQTP
jgi:hypothetical protein